MKIVCEVNGTTNTGKPAFKIKCEHCHLCYTGLSSFVYDICRPKGIEPPEKPREAAQTFEWVVNSKGCPKKLRQNLCNCDENPIGLVGQWFRTNSRKIDKYELESACDQIRLYAIKDGIDPYDSEAHRAVKDLKSEVKKHNAKFP